MVVTSTSFITKILLPHRRGDVLRRSRLIEFLHEHVDRRLILVCAAAGYGKTTLLVDFAHDVPIPVCWYSLGPADADVRVFLEYMVASIKQRFPDFGEQTLNALYLSNDLAKELSAVIGVMVSEMHAVIPEYFIVVLDDYHFVDGSDQVNAAIDLLLHHLPENCHLAIASRTVPRLTLTRLAAHRQVAGLGTSDLRFTAEEIRQFLSDNHKLLLPVKTADALALESEGWIAGIILSTHTMWQGLFESIIKAKGAGGEVFDYLATEVFSQQPPDVQQFLLAVSILEQLDAGVCGEVAGISDAAVKLAYLEDSNLFVSRLEGAGDWYRFHQLFRAFLQNKLSKEHPAWHIDLQARAADSALKREAWDEAVGHLTLAGRYEEASKVIVSRADDLIDSGKLLTLARWVDGLPGTVLAAYPMLSLVRGRIHFKSGEPERSLQVLTLACQRFGETGDEAGLARALAARSIALAIKGRHAEAIGDCTRALELIGEGNQRAAAEIQRNLGICHGMQGNFRESVVALTVALRLQRDGDEYSVATLHHSLGMANAKLGDFPRARFHFDEALAIWERLGNVGCWGQTLNSLGLLLFDEGDQEDALRMLGDALAKVREGNNVRVESAVLGDIGDVYRASGMFAEAIEHYEKSLEIARHAGEGYFAGYALNGLGDAHARMGEYRKADRFIRQALVQAEDRQSSYERGMYDTSLGMLQCDQGQAGKALRTLARAGELLREAGAQRELTRALLARGRALYLLNRHDEAVEEVRAALEIGTETDYEQFLTRDGERCLGLLSLARDKGIADPRLDNALRLLRAHAAVPAKVDRAPVLQPVPQPCLAPLEALALGQARVLREGKEITRSGWSSDKVRELFFYLLGHTYSLSKDQIVESLWPDLPSASYNSTFHSTMYRLRRALQGEYILQRDGRYRLSPDAECTYDVREFERLSDQANSLPRDSIEAAAICRQAVSLYKGPYLKEFTAEWAEARRNQLASRYLSTLATLASAVAANGQFESSIELCQRVLVEDTLREDAHDLLLRCYVALDDHVSALRHYRHYASLLMEELGVAPSPKLRAIYDQIVGDHDRHPKRRPVRQGHLAR